MTPKPIKQPEWLYREAEAPGVAPEAFQLHGQLVIALERGDCQDARRLMQKRKY